MPVITFLIMMKIEQQGLKLGQTIYNRIGTGFSTNIICIVKKDAHTSRWNACKQSTKGWQGRFSLMKKRLAVVLLALMLLCTFSGCREKEKESYSDIQTEVLKQADIHIYTQGYGSDGQPRDKAAIDNMLSEIAKSVSETLSVVPIFHWIPYEQYDSEITKLVQSADQIDAFTCYSPQAYVEQNLLADITDLFPEYASQYYSELYSSQLGRDYLYQGSVDGKLYLIPYNGLENPRYCVVTRKEFAEKYAPDGLETMEDYGEFLKKIKENETGAYPGSVNAHDFFIAYMEGNEYYTEFATYFFSRLNEPTSHYAMEQTPEFLEAWNLLKEWHEKEYTAVDRSPNNLLNGKLASELVPVQSVENVLGNLTNADAQFTIIPLYMESTHVIYTGGKGLVISKNSAIPERVVSFVEWIHESQEHYDLFRYGIKDKNFSLQKDRILFPPSVKPFTSWYAVDYFTDIRYERLSPNLDADFKETYLEAGTKNTVTTRQLQEEILKNIKKNPKTFEDLTREYEQINPMIQVYFKNMEEFIDSINQQTFHMTPEELSEKQQEAGVEQILAVYRKQSK